MFRADVLMKELERFEPAMASAAEQSVAKAQTDLQFLRLDTEAFASAPQKSIDYAVMEKTDRAAVVIGNFGWSDIGSWDAILDIAEDVHIASVILLLLLIPVHAGAALKHHFWDRHDVLRGMLPEVPNWEGHRATPTNKPQAPQLPRESEAG